MTVLISISYNLGATQFVLNETRRIAVCSVKCHSLFPF